MKKITFTLFILFFTIVMGEVKAQDQAEMTPDMRVESMMRNQHYRETIRYIDSLDVTPQLSFQQAMCYKSLGNYGKALTILQQLTNEDAANIRYNTEIAECFMALYNWKKSADTYEFLTRLDSTNIYFEMQYANMQLKLGEYPQALTVYTNIYDKYALQSVYKYKGECFENMNMPDTAMVYYKKAWEVDDYDTYSLANYINLNIKSGLIPEALQVSDDFIEKDSTNRIINRLNAIAYYSTNFNYAGAAVRFERCWRLGDKSVEISKGLGMCYYFLRIADKAYPHMTRAYMADSANLNNLYPLAEICNDLEKNEEAIKYYNKVLEQIVPKRTALYMNHKGLAESYERNEQYDDALSNYLQAVRYCHEEQKMNLYYSMGTMCADKAHNYKEAIYYYEKYKERLSVLLYVNEQTYKNPKPTTFVNAKGEKDMSDVETIKDEAKARIVEVTGKIESLDIRIAELKGIWNQQLAGELEPDSIYASTAYRYMKKSDSTVVKVDSMNDSLKSTDKDSIAASLWKDGVILVVEEEM